MRVLVLLLAVSLAGCLNDFDEAPLQNHLSISDVDVAAPEVRTGFLTLRADVEVDNEQARSGDVKVRVKAFDTATGLLVDTQWAPLGTIARDTTVLATVRFDLPRDTGYRLEISLLQDDRLMREEHVEVRNLANLAPTLHETGLRVGQMDFFIENVTGSQVRITSGVYITNEGDGMSEPLRIQVKAREVSTSLIADEGWTTLAPIAPEATHVIEVQLQVPAGYNYEVEATLWEGDFIVEQGKDNVQLLPTFEKPKDTEIEVTEPDLREFRRSAGDSGEEARTPGPAIGAILLLIGVIAWRKRT